MDFREEEGVARPSLTEGLRFSSPMLTPSPVLGTVPATARLSSEPRTLHPRPNHLVWNDGVLRLRERAWLTVGAGVSEETVSLFKETWRQFSSDAVALVVVKSERMPPLRFSVTIRESALIRSAALPAQTKYVLSANEAGIAGAAADTQGLRYAWYSCLQLLQLGEPEPGLLELTVPHMEIRDWPNLAFRGLHLCVFPETTVIEIEKAIRLAALLKFTHVVVEFWGTLKLECLRELSWPQGWDKDVARRLFGIARHMGLEIVPMYNCWGHAAGSRIRYGRHVVLDQNPRLATLFEPDGWTWCLTNPASQAMLRAICDELMELAGPGGYFHIGCDEAYSHGSCDRCREQDPVQLFADHVNGMVAHVESRGRRAIMWGDALLERAQWPLPYEANGLPSLPTHESLENLSRSVIIADWHYEITQGARTAEHFSAAGFEVMACAWTRRENIRFMAESADAVGGGLLATTWNKLSFCMPQLAWTATAAWAADRAVLDGSEFSWPLLRGATASFVRKLVPARGNYEQAGWNPHEITPDLT